MLAGGAARRMGGLNKGLQCFHGQPLARRAAERLAPQVSQVMISANGDLDTFGRWGWRVISDSERHRDHGPLAGMLAGLEACTTPWLVCVPCDVPHFPVDLVSRLAERAGSALVVYAATPADPDASAPPRRHPTCCLLSRLLCQPLNDYLTNGGRRLDAWMRSQPHAEVVFDNGHAFANLNTLAELVSAQSGPVQLG